MILNIMTPAKDVVVVHAGTPFKEIARRLAERRISAVPVVDEQTRVVGVVSEADLLHKESRLEPQRPSVFAGRQGARAQEKGDAVTAEGLMTSPAVTVGPGDDVVRAARLMADHKVKRLPVVDKHGRLLGIVSRADLLGLFTRPDAEIRSEVLDGVLLRTLWIDPREMDVSVADGVVRLRGTVETRSVAELVGKMVRHTDGVVDVFNELAWVRDDSGDKVPAGRLHGVFEHRRPGT
ncbi:MAG: CBS domain-containing protein [Catenulisporales bacterium]|nr:CBS domain-containing protein [Catenulisporales bacterium]